MWRDFSFILKLKYFRILWKLPLHCAQKLALVAGHSSTNASNGRTSSKTNIHLFIILLSFFNVHLLSASRNGDDRAINALENWAVPLHPSKCFNEVAELDLFVFVLLKQPDGLYSSKKTWVHAAFFCMHDTCMLVCVCEYACVRNRIMMDLLFDL